MPEPFRVEYSALVENVQNIERKIHKIFNKKRARKNREFFVCTVPEVIVEIRKIATIQDEEVFYKSPEQINEIKRKKYEEKLVEENRRIIRKRKEEEDRIKLRKQREEDRIKLHKQQEEDTIKLRKLQEEKRKKFIEDAIEGTKDVSYHFIKVMIKTILFYGSLGLVLLVSISLSRVYGGMMLLLFAVFVPFSFYIYFKYVDTDP